MRWHCACMVLFNCLFFFLLIDIVDIRENSTGQHIPFEVVDPSDLDCSLCMRCVLFSQIIYSFPAVSSSLLWPRDFLACLLTYFCLWHEISFDCDCYSSDAFLDLWFWALLMNGHSLIFSGLVIALERAHKLTWGLSMLEKVSERFALTTDTVHKPTVVTWEFVELFVRKA